MELCKYLSMRKYTERHPFVFMTSLSAAIAGAVLAMGVQAAPSAVMDTDGDVITIRAGHPSLAKWRLADKPKDPSDNPTTLEKVVLGKHLYFDPRLSGNGTVSCATCHNPSLGYADGLGRAVGMNGAMGQRSSPTIINSGYNSLQMWDGSKKSLEAQAVGPMEASNEMATDFEQMLRFIYSNKGYVYLFNQAFPDQPVTLDNMAKAIAAYERTVISNDSPFDRWVKGDPEAMTPAQINGFALFIDPNKGNCAVCHSGGNFTDSSFHNLGLKPTDDKPDVGRYHIKKVKTMQGAFKTPTVREVTRTAPYMHDGSIETLMEVVEHYVKGGEVKDNLSPLMKPLTLTEKEKQDLVVFMEALSGPFIVETFPDLPK
jgi:cytochrome c peroxidase